jgi:hypothetical protein
MLIPVGTAASNISTQLLLWAGCWPAVGPLGLLAVSSVLPDQIEHLAVHLLTVQTSGIR